MKFLKMFVDYNGKTYNITDMTLEESIETLELKSAPGFEDYLISPNGYVFSKQNGKLKPVSPAPNNDGYLQFVAYLGKDKKRKWLVHRYLYAAHIGPILEGYVIKKINPSLEYSKDNIEQVKANLQVHAKGKKNSPKAS